METHGTAHHETNHLVDLIEHFLEHPTEHLWNTAVSINSALCALAIVYLLYATAASFYYLTPRPFVIGALLVFFLLCTEITLSVLEEALD